MRVFLLTKNNMLKFRLFSGETQTNTFLFNMCVCADIIFVLRASVYNILRMQHVTYCEQIIECGLFGSYLRGSSNLKKNCRIAIQCLRIAPYCSIEFKRKIDRVSRAVIRFFIFVTLA